MKVEETSFLNEYIAMADYGDRLGWHERNGGNFTYWMVPMWTTLQMNIF